MTAVLSETNSAQSLFKLLDFFEKMSGLMLNTIKTEGMWIGSSRENQAKPFGIKALGVYCSYDLKLRHENNFFFFNIWEGNPVFIYLKICCMLHPFYPPPKRNHPRVK